MINKYLRKVIVLGTITISVLALNPTGVNAEWKQDSTGWWYTEGTSCSVGWKEIYGKWYYFGQDGYMVHDTTIDGYTLGSDGAWVQSNTSTSDNTNKNIDSFDISVNLKYNIHLDDKIKGTNPNIIKATRQAIFDSDCYFAKIRHYNGYSINNDVLIFDVKEMGTDEWEVDFYEKKSDEKDYDTIGYLVATVTKQKDGSYEGGIAHSTIEPSQGETY